MKRILPLFVILLLAGCETAATVTPMAGRSEPIARGSIVALDVRARTDAESVRAGRALRESLARALTRSAGFASVVAPTASAHYHLDVTMDLVGPAGEPELFGLLGETRGVMATATLMNRATRRVVTTLRVTGQGTDLPLVSDPHDAAIDAAADKIAEALR